MNKKFLSIIFCSAITFLSFGKNATVSAFKQEAVTRIIETSNTDKKIHYIFTEYLQGVKISMLLGRPVGIHTVDNYCYFLGCQKNDLNNFLDIDNNSPLCDAEGNIINKDVINDFMALAEKVEEHLHNN